MQLELSDDSKLVQGMFERFFETESGMSRVRGAEPIGFDRALWKGLVDIEAPFMRIPGEHGGGGMSLLQACLMMEQAGRRLATAPLAEAVVALATLSRIGGVEARSWIERTRAGETVISLAVRTGGGPQLVTGGAVAQGVLGFDGEALVMLVPKVPVEPVKALAGTALGVIDPAACDRLIIARGHAALSAWAAATAEWKLLTSAALLGLSHEALAMAAGYAGERIAFGKPIGANQGIAHPLATDVMDVDAAGLLLWWALGAIRDGHPLASASIDMLFWWSARSATNSVAHSLHTFGGYGLTNEYDIQLYHRRAKAWPLVWGDPRDAMAEAGRAIVHPSSTVLPDVGEIEIDFTPPSGGEELAAEMRALLGRVIDPERHNLVDCNFEAHDWEVYQAIGAAGLIFPNWPEEWGGRGADALSTQAVYAVWQEVGYTTFPRDATSFVGQVVQEYGAPELQEEVLRRFAAGQAIACLGYTEPSGGSDVFAAQTRAVREGEDWIINGQKMFTSGAELASYALLVTRTDPAAPKHKGISLFLVPLDAAGVSVDPVHTFMDERTNATFYEDVRVSDRYRIGPANGGARVLATALASEQSGGHYHEKMVGLAKAAAKALDEQAGSALKGTDSYARLAEVHLRARLSELLSLRVRWTWYSGAADLAYGPAAKVFSTDSYIASAADMLDLAAPYSLVRGKSGLGLIEQAYRASAATSIYGGTSEVLRSMVAERRLGLPRSRE